MALVLADRVQETTTTAGTGPLTLGGAVSGFQSFAVVGNANICYYTVVDGATWEVGIGTYSTTGPTLTRTTILSNSSGTTSPLTLSSASKPIFLTYPSEKSVNLDSSGNVSPLGTVASGAWQGSTVGVAYGGTGVTASSGANSVVLRDSNQNTYVNSVTQALTIVTAAAGITTLTLASPHFQILVGTGAQTFKMPDATTLPTGSSWVFDNDSTGNLTVTNNAGTTIDVVAPGGYTTVFLEADGTVGGSWGRFGMIPAEVNWGTNSLDLGGSTVITNGIWQGTTVASGYGGTGLTTFTGANNALYSTGAATLTAGTLPVLAGGTGATTAAGAQTSLNVPSTTGTGASGTWGINITGSAGSAPGYLPLSGGTLTGPLTVGGSVTIGTGGTYAAGSIYSDASWGMIFRAKQAAPGNAQFRWANSADVELARIDTGGTFINVGAISAPTFYDSDNTAYYVSPASTSVLNTISQAGVYSRNAAGVGYLSGNYGGGGETDSTTGAIYTIGNSYVPTSTSFNSMYGIGYCFATYLATGITGANGWGMYVNSGGSNSVWLGASGGTVISKGEHRGTIFYDYDNTGYYVDPNSNSTIFDLTIAGASNKYLYINPGNGYEAMVRYNGGSGSGWYVGKRTANVLVTSADFHFYSEAAATTVAGVDTSGNMFASSSSRAPIFYDLNNTAYYVDPASTSLLNNLTLVGGLSNSNSGLRLVSPGDGSIYTAGYAYGAIKIRLPVGWTSTMMRFTVKVYTYDGLSFDINCGGYNYGGGYWINTFATMQTQSRPALNVRFAFDGTYCCVFIGELSNTWLYPQVFVTDVQCGYSAFDAGSWDDGWAVSYETSSFGTVYETQVVYPPLSSSNNTSNAYAGIYYDYNDTAYYVDPNSISVIGSVLVGGTTAAWPYQAASNGYITFGATTDAASYSIRTEMEDYNGTYSKLRFKWYTGIQHYAASYYGGHRFYDINGTYFFGIATGSGVDYSYSVYSHRAPIFYDSNDSAFYIDPASTNDNALRMRGGALFGPNTTWGAYLAVGGNGNQNTAYANVAATNGNLHMDAAVNCDMYLNYYAGNAVRAYGSFYTPILYDLNDTSWYVDPGTTTRLNNLTVATVGVGTAAFGATGEIRATANVTAYYSSDIKFKTNVRTIPNALETVEYIGGKLFDWKDEYIEEHGGEDGYFIQKEDFGVVAQDVLKAFPVAVRTRPDGSLAVDYEKLSALAFAAVAELSTRVKSLEART